MAREAQAIYHELGDWNSEAALLLNVVKAHFKEKNPKEGAETAEEVLAIYRRAGDRRQQAVMLQEIAEIQLGRRMPTKAIKAASEALALFHEFEDCNGVQRAEFAG